LTGFFERKHFLFFLLVFSGLAFIRYYRLSACGFFDDDNAVYITVMHQWMDGIFNNNVAKPGYHLLCLAASKLIGLYDDTVFYLNSTMDLAGIVILYFLARRVRLNVFLALSTVVIYGCLPAILFENTRGLAHLPVMSFVAASVWFFFLSREGSRWRPFLLSNTTLART